MTKTEILHIRKKSQPQSNFMFLFGVQPVKYCKEYKYLGLTLNEHLDFKLSTGILAESGGRSLSSVITKMIKHGGFPLNVFKVLFNSCVCSVTDYGSEVWGYKEYESISKIQQKAARSFLGLPKQAAIPGLLSELNWIEPRSRTQLQIIRYYHKLNKMDDQRLTKKVYLWDRKLNDSGRIKTWSSEVRDILDRNGLINIYTQNIFSLDNVSKALKQSLFKKDQNNWKSKCLPLPKLRTFNKFKNFSSDSPHIFKPLSFMQRKMLSKFRLGLLHLRIETARFVRPKIPPEERVCLICNNGEVEDESHFLLICSKFDQQRQVLFNKIPDSNSFHALDAKDKLNFLVNDPNIVKQTAKFIVDAFEFRSTLL